MVKYGEIVPGVLEDNPILRDFIAYILQCAARRKRVATSPDFQPADAKLAASWLGAKIREAPDSRTALNCLEAATAVEVCIDNLNVYLPIAVIAIRQTYRLYWRENQSPPAPQDFVALMCKRAFWGPVRGLTRPKYYRRTLLYPPDWHMSRKEDMESLLRSFLADEQIEGKAWHEAVAEVFDGQKAHPAAKPAGRGQKSYVDTTGTFRLQHVWLAWIGSQKELEFVTDGLSNLQERQVRGMKGDSLLARALAMFGGALTYLATDRMISNAQAIRTTLLGEVTDRPQAPVEITKLLAFAEHLVGPPPPRLLDRPPVLRVPWGMEVIGDTIAFHGESDLSQQERNNIALYFRLAGDLWVVGAYLLDQQYVQRTVGDYLADHPRVDPEEFADRINPQKRSTDSDVAYRKALQQFGSKYYFNRNRKGYGFNT